MTLGPTPVPSSERSTPATHVRRRFSDELRELATALAEKPASLGAILDATQGRGFGLLLVLVALPFVTPISLIGLSTPFGLVVAIIGGRLALGRHPWLPERLLRRELPPRFVGRVLTAARVVVRWLEVLARPRFDFFHEQELYRRVAGGLIAISGVLLLLPIPVPFTNTLPALTVLLLAAGSVERDGLFFVGGFVMFLVTVSYFVLLAIGGAHVLDALWR
jgi:hypothetical protein